MIVQAIFYIQPNSQGMSPEELIAIAPDEKQAYEKRNQVALDEFRKWAPMDNHPRTDIENYIIRPFDMTGHVTVHDVLLFHEGYDYTTHQTIGIYGSLEAAEAAITENIAEERENWDVAEGNRSKHDEYIPALDRDNYSISTRFIFL